MGLTTSQHALDTYCDALRAAGLDAPWSRPGPLIASKQARVQPCVWRWADIEPLLLQSAEFVTPDQGAERRILRLMNPGVPERTSTHTLSVAVQLLLPGETAPVHRHTPNAIRFMLKGRGAYTNVGAERCDMAPGDLVLTPNMQWHEHGNTGNDPVMWVDGLDSPVVRYLEMLAMQGRDVPTSAFPSQPRAEGSRTIHYHWTDARRALFDPKASAAATPSDDVIVEYRDPKAGDSVLPTLGCYLQAIRPGVSTSAHRQTSSAVYHVVEGRGRTTMGDTTYDWSAGDFFAIPPMLPHAHANTGSEPAVLFSLQDVPMLTKLGLYFEESA